MLNGPTTRWVVTLCILFPLNTCVIFLQILAARIRGTRLRLSDYLIQAAYVFQVGYIISLSVLGMTSLNILLSIQHGVYSEVNKTSFCPRCLRLPHCGLDAGQDHILFEGALFLTLIYHTPRNLDESGS